MKRHVASTLSLLLFLYPAASFYTVLATRTNNYQPLSHSAVGTIVTLLHDLITLLHIQISPVIHALILGSLHSLEWI